MYGVLLLVRRPVRIVLAVPPEPEPTAGLPWQHRLKRSANGVLERDPQAFRHCRIENVVDCRPEMECGTRVVTSTRNRFNP